MKKLYTPDLVSSGQYLECGHCGGQPREDEHDACLGELPDKSIMNACCGHGNDAQAYIQYWDKERIEGDIAIKEQNKIKNIALHK